MQSEDGETRHQSGEERGEQGGADGGAVVIREGGGS